MAMVVYVVINGSESSIQILKNESLSVKADIFTVNDKLCSSIGTVDGKADWKE